MPKQLLENFNVKKLLEHAPQNILAEIQFLTLSKNTRITQKGSDIKFVYFFITGSVTVLRLIQSGKMYASLEMKEPYFIGDLEVISNNFCAAASTVTSSEAKVFRISARSFAAWFNNSEYLARLIAVINTTKLWQNSSVQGEFLMLDTYYRFLSQLKMDYLENYSGDETTTFKKTKISYSIETGVSIRTIAKKIARAKQEGLLQRDNRLISLSKSQFDAVCGILDTIL